MNEKEYITDCDKRIANLPPGEWNNEPHIVRFKKMGFDCLILRNKNTLHLNGYIRIPENHPWHQKNEDQIKVKVHGGITHAGYHKLIDDGQWWIGFDCAHFNDQIPLMGFVDDKASYRNISYVRHQLSILSSQARKAWQKKTKKKE